MARGWRERCGPCRVTRELTREKGLEPPVKAGVEVTSLALTGGYRSLSL